jgi:hypothetical protein
VIVPSEINLSPENLSSFQFDFNNDRIQFLEEQVERLRVEILTLKRLKGSMNRVTSAARWVQKGLQKWASRAWRSIFPKTRSGRL